MAVRTAGEVGYLLYEAEGAYGTMPTSALDWGADVLSFTTVANWNTEEYFIPGSRTFNASTRGGSEVGFNVRGYSRVGSGWGGSWKNFWALYGMGATNGTTAEHLGSFTTQMEEVVSSSHFYSFFNGSKIDKMIISSEGPGKPIIFEADVISQYIEKETSKSVTGIQTVTIGADPTAPTTAQLRWAAVSQINLAGGGLANWYPKSWKLTIENHLERQMGHKTGGDSAVYNVPIAINEGIRDITFEGVLWHENETYTNAKVANSAVTAVTIPIDTDTVTLNNGIFLGDDYPELKHDLMEEPFRIKFKSVSIA